MMKWWSDDEMTTRSLLVEKISKKKVNYDSQYWFRLTNRQSAHTWTLQALRRRQPTVMFALLQKTIAACQNCFPRFYLLIITEQRIVSRVRESRHTSDTFVASSSSSSLIEASFKQTPFSLPSWNESSSPLSPYRFVCPCLYTQFPVP